MIVKHKIRVFLYQSSIVYQLSCTHTAYIDGVPIILCLLLFTQITSALPERWQSPDAVLPKEVSESMQPFFKFLAAAIETFANSASSSDAGSHAFRCQHLYFYQLTLSLILLVMVNYY